MSERRRLVATLLATVLAAPLLLVEIAPGADAGPDAALTAFQQAPVASQARAVGSLSSEDLATTRLFSTLSVGDELRAEAEAAAAEEAEAEEAAAEEAAREAAAREEAEEAEAARRAAAERAARATTTTSTTAPPPPPPPAPEPAPSTGPTAAQWAALRQCESGGNYSIVSSNGLYYGAYQFGIATWNGTAQSAGRPDLVGVQPNLAAPADQDAMAYALYAMRGAQPWPHCGRHLY